MQTQCPHCRTVYEVSEQFVEALDARVRCSQCMTVFNARDSLMPVVGGEDVYLVDDDDPLDDTVVIDSLLEVDAGADDDVLDSEVASGREASTAVEDSDVDTADEAAAPATTVGEWPPIIDEQAGEVTSVVVEDELPDLTSEIELPELDLPDFGFTLEENTSSGSAAISDASEAQAVCGPGEIAPASSVAEPREPVFEPAPDSAHVPAAKAGAAAPIEKATGFDTASLPEMEADISPEEITGGKDADPAESTSAEAIEEFTLETPYVAPATEVDAPTQVVSAQADGQPGESDDRAATEEELPIPDLLREQMAEGPAQPRRRRQWPWSLGALLLATAIGTQFVLWQWDSLAARPGVRPLLNSVCKLAGCELAPLRDVSAIRLLQRSVYSHPNVQGALIISVSMINEADFAQPFPTLAIRMTDRQGKAVAARNFAPDSYLPAAQHGAQMAPSAPTTITLEVLDPGRDARSYELDFL